MMKEPQGPAGRLLAAAALVLLAGWAAASSAVRTDDSSAVQGLSTPPPVTGWVTQEWPQRGQNGTDFSTFTAPFTQGPYVDCTHGSACAMLQNASGHLGIPVYENKYPFCTISGAMATEYFINARRAGPYGIGFDFANGFEGYLEIRSIGATPNGSYSGANPCELFGQGGAGSGGQLQMGCAMVGTPIVIPYEPGGSSYAVVLGGDRGCGGNFSGGLTRMIIQIKGSVVHQGKAQIQTYTAFEVASTESLLRPVEYPPCYDGLTHVFVATRGVTWPYQGSEPSASVLHSMDWTTMTPTWSADLTIGNGGTEVAPKGAPPPPAPESYYACASPAADNSLVIVAGQQMSLDSGVWNSTWPVLLENSVLFAFNAVTGAQVWTFKLTGARIMPNPALLPDVVIFGTDDGRAFALNRTDGTVRWQTPSGSRLKAAAEPINLPEVLSNVALYGPAISPDKQYAVFGGSDGCVHRYAAQGGSRTDSQVLLYASTRWNGNPYSGPMEIDANGYRIFRPIGIYTTPVICNNQFIAVRCDTRYQTTGGLNCDYNHRYPVPYNSNGSNASFLAVLKYSDLSFNQNILTASIVNRGIQLDPEAAKFRGAFGGSYGIVAMAPYADLNYDRVYNFNYIDWPGDSFYGFESWNQCLWASPIEASAGGLSLADGMLFATDKAGNVVGIPSSVPFNCGTGGPVIGPLTGPEPPSVLPPALGPIQAFPNPYIPDIAINGTFKFRNLPAGSIVDLFTLAYEQVNELTERNNAADWDGRNAAGQAVATGVYLYRIKIPGQDIVKGRIALVRK